jgi:hypothetical protein
MKTKPNASKDSAGKAPGKRKLATKPSDSKKGATKTSRGESGGLKNTNTTKEIQSKTRRALPGRGGR